MKTTFSRLFALLLALLTLTGALCSCQSSSSDTIGSFALTESQELSFHPLPFGATQEEFFAAFPDAESYEHTFDDNLPETMKGLYGTSTLLSGGQRLDLYVSTAYDKTLKADVTTTYGFVDDFFYGVDIFAASRNENLSQFAQRISQRVKKQLPEYHRKVEEQSGISFAEQSFTQVCLFSGEKTSISITLLFDNKIQKTVAHITCFQTRK